MAFSGGLEAFVSVIGTRLKWSMCPLIMISSHFESPKLPRMVIHKQTIIWNKIYCGGTYHKVEFSFCMCFYFIMITMLNSSKNLNHIVELNKACCVYHAEIVSKMQSILAIIFLFSANPWLYRDFVRMDPRKACLLECVEPVKCQVWSIVWCSFYSIIFCINLQSLSSVRSLNHHIWVYNV